MTTEYASVEGIQWLKGSTNKPNSQAIALISLVVAAAVTSGDTIKVGDATNGKRNGQTVAKTLAQMLQDDRRDGKTVTLGALGGDGIAILSEPGSDGTTDFYAKTIAETDTNANITLILCDVAASNLGAASGMSVRPMQIAVSVKLT